MENKSRGQKAALKAWITMRNKSPEIQEDYKRRRKAGAGKAVLKVKNKQWESEKVEYLKELMQKATPNACIVCDDKRPYVLQKHHADPLRTIEVKVCANCHDIIRRANFENLKNAHDIRFQRQSK